MSRALVHLHPDFSQELSEIILKWNAVQNICEFVGIRVRREHEVKLLTGGAMNAKECIALGGRIRTEAGFSPDDNLIIFTEKRIFESSYHQLYIAGSDEGDSIPNVAAISLDFTRKVFSSPGNGSELVFQIILSNIISVFSMSEGFETHDDTRGCPLDFCNNMTDILVGIKNGFSFCEADQRLIKNRNKTYLFSLTTAIAPLSKADASTMAISKRIMSTEKARLKEDESLFNYDIAVSFAGEDRENVEQVINLLLARRGIKVFYDKFEKSKLWGEDVYSQLTDIYLRAKYCVMFISEHYARSRWTNLERQAAQSRALQQNEAYILPVRFDNTVIPGMLPIISYLEWADEGAEGIANAIFAKLGI